MDDSELVVVCHCEKHAQLYVTKNDMLVRPLDNKKVSFVDPFVCKEKTWDKIETSSKQYVWAYGCPIALVLMSDILLDKDDYWTGNFFDILKNSKRILKPGGQFITGIDNAIHPDKINLEKFVGVPELSDWTIKMINANDYIFNLGKEEDGLPLNVKNNLMIFTLVSVGGKRKNTRKRKARNHASKLYRRRTARSSKFGRDS